MKKHICYLFIILFTTISLPLSVASANDTPVVDVQQETQMVNINKADFETLALLKGVGVKRAKAIVAYRELYGEFNAVDDLLNVKGIGEQTLLLNKARITL
jgi:competence protein ComEA